MNVEIKGINYRAYALYDGYPVILGAKMYEGHDKFQRPNILSMLHKTRSHDIYVRVFCNLDNFYKYTRGKFTFNQMLKVVTGNVQIISVTYPTFLFVGGKIRILRFMSPEFFSRWY